MLKLPLKLMIRLKYGKPKLEPKEKFLIPREMSFCLFLPQIIQKYTSLSYLFQNEVIISRRSWIDEVI